MRQHLARQIADLLALEAEVYDCIRAVGQVDDGPGDGLVEGGVAPSEAREGGAGAQGKVEGGAECEEGVFCCVVVVDWSMLVGWFIVQQVGEWGDCTYCKDLLCI